MKHESMRTIAFDELLDELFEYNVVRNDYKIGTPGDGSLISNGASAAPGAWVWVPSWSAATASASPSTGARRPGISRPAVGESSASPFGVDEASVGRRRSQSPALPPMLSRRHDLKEFGHFGNSNGAYYHHPAWAVTAGLQSPCSVVATANPRTRVSLVQNLLCYSVLCCFVCCAQLLFWALLPAAACDDRRPKSTTRAGTSTSAPLIQSWARPQRTKLHALCSRIHLRTTASIVPGAQCSSTGPVAPIEKCINFGRMLAAPCTATTRQCGGSSNVSSMRTRQCSHSSTST